MAKRRSASKHRARSRGRLLFLLLLLAAAGGYLAWRHELQRLEAHRDELRARFAQHVNGGRLLAAAPRSDIALGVPHAYAQSVLREVAAHLLNDVSLDVSDLRVRKRGSVRKRILLRNATVGHWLVDAHIRRLQGVLRAGRPSLRFAGDDQIALTVPVTVEAGQIESRLRFSWDSKGLARAVCRDFTTRQRVEASIVPETYTLAGHLKLVAEGDELGVQTHLTRRKLRVRLRPTKRTWARARAALDRQDSFWKCGVALNPENVMEKLRDLVASGFDVTLPANLFPPLRIPASFRRSIEEEGRQLTLGVHVDALRVTPGVLWYGASVSTSVPPQP